MPVFLSTLGPWFGVCGLFGIALAAWSAQAALRGQALASARRAHAACTLLALAYWPVAFPGNEPRPDLVETGPISDLGVTLLAVAGAWIWLGILLYVLGRRPWTLLRSAYWLALTLLTTLALGMLRERFLFGDVHDYVLAAEQIARGEVLHGRYLYPPLLATLLAPLAAFGPRVVVLTCLSSNVVGLLLMFELLRRALKRYAFSDLSATLLTFAALSANVAVQRTLFYVQMNFHMANLMLLSLLCYPTQPLLSALALALAVHIKTSPLVLALPYLLARDWKWLSYFAAAVLGLVLFTSLLNGPQHYAEYLHNVSNVYLANGISFRENSLDSLVRASLRLLELDLERATLPLLVLKALLLALGLWLCRLAVLNRSFFPGAQAALGADRASTVMNTYPVLMLLLATVSPLLWEHHPVLFVLTLLVMLKRVEGEADAVLWLLAWFLIYLLPTFDIYPFSYKITLGAGLSYWLLWRQVHRPSGEGSAFLRTQTWLQRLVAQAAAPIEDQH